ncbi:Protein of unknown function [Pyronema omphalodes CBS 100304]|uniref:Uncharacterized protein n=1 Tax=Pyronema omphalodes (strain CBS 100304) TaxID=1076935 RepID=U4KZM2_PYROM|nr:Protein of unknown function [Pyronema omphalodes CBS 100304]
MVDVQLVPAGTKLPSACATLRHFKLLTDGSCKWKILRRFSATWKANLSLKDLTTAEV